MRDHVWNFITTEISKLTKNTEKRNDQLRKPLQNTTNEGEQFQITEIIPLISYPY